MKLLFNDLSLCGQFKNIEAFEESINRIMAMRKVAMKFKYNFYCHKNMLHSQVTDKIKVNQAIKFLNKNKVSALIQWIGRIGPYWQDEQIHNQDDYLECDNEIVTNNAIGEAAMHNFKDDDCRLVSLKPSPWEESPLTVSWYSDNENSKEIDVRNYISQEILEEDLASAPKNITSWEELAESIPQLFTNLTFANNAFVNLKYPFQRTASDNIIKRLRALEELKTCVDKHGNQSPETQRLHKRYFEGSRPWFSDSSQKEKAEFRDKLTFKHPTEKDKTLFCPKHGKIHSPHRFMIRIHYYWERRKNSHLYVVYVGEKITKK